MVKVASLFWRRGKEWLQRLCSTV